MESTVCGIVFNTTSMRNECALPVALSLTFLPPLRSGPDELPNTLRGLGFHCARSPRSRRQWVLLGCVDECLRELESPRISHLANLKFAALIAFQGLLELVVGHVVVGHNALHEVEPIPPVDGHTKQTDANNVNRRLVHV